MSGEGQRGQTVLDFAVGVSVFLIVVAFVLTFIPGMVQPFQESTQQETAAANRLAEQLAAGMLVEDVSEPYVLDRACTVIFFESREDGNDPLGDDLENTDDDATLSNPFGTGSYGGSCVFGGVSVDQRLATDESGLNLRISIVADLSTAAADNPDSGTNDDVVEPLCVDRDGADDTLDTGDDDRIIEGNDPFTGGQCDLTSGDDDVLLRIGETPPSDRSSVVVARRFISVEGGFADGTDQATLVVEVW